MVLDGHFTLLDKNGDIVELPFETFDGIDIRKIVLKRELPSVIKDRLENRDRTLWDIDLIDNFQETEIKRVQQFSMEKNISASSSVRKMKCSGCRMYSATVQPCRRL